jgi:L-ascorbate metabolism protein UlaG (beta-lactamase superfamily)
MHLLRRSPVETLSAVSVPQDSLLLNWIGQAGFLFKSPGGATLCVDPYLSNSIEKYEGLENRRMWWPAFPLERLRVDTVFLTHDHLDHTDPETLPLIEGYCKPRYFAPASSAAHLRAMGVREQAITTIQVGDCLYFEDIVLRPVHAEHTIDSVGLLLEAAGLKVYLTGDTALCPQMTLLRNEGIDVLISCINGIYNNLNVEQAVELAKNLQARMLIPMHFGVVPANTVRPERFLNHCARTATPNCLLEPEEHYLLRRQAAQIRCDRIQ